MLTATNQDRDRRLPRLPQSQTRLKLATEVAQLGVLMWDTLEVRRGSGKMTAYYEIFGRTRKEGSVNGTAFMNEVVHPDYRQAFRRAMRIDAAGNSPKTNYKFEEVISTSR